MRPPAASRRGRRRRHRRPWPRTLGRPSIASIAIPPGNPDTGAVRPRLGPLLAAVLLVVAVAGAAVALLRLADRREADRAAEQARQATTVPSAGVDRQPNDSPAPTAPPDTTLPTATPADEGPAVVLRGDG